jgi:4-carboxymuconolactone decarboxylase
MACGEMMRPEPLRLRSSANTSGEVQRVLSKLEASGLDLDIVALMANWQPGFRSFILMADSLLNRGVLAPELRELAVLHIAKSLELTYEWHEHVPIARRAGVTDVQIQAIDEGRWRSGGVTCFSSEGLMVLRCADELATTGRLSASLWERACATLGQAATLEVVIGFAWWGGFVRVVIESLMPLADRS